MAPATMMMTHPTSDRLNQFTADPPAVQAQQWSGHLPEERPRQRGFRSAAACCRAYGVRRPCRRFHKGGHAARPCRSKLRRVQSGSKLPHSETKGPALPPGPSISCFAPELQLVGEERDNKRVDDQRLDQCQTDNHHEADRAG